MPTPTYLTPQPDLLTPLMEYVQTYEYYRIKEPLGDQELADITASLCEGQRLFFDTFGVDKWALYDAYFDDCFDDSFQGRIEKSFEALRFFCFSHYIRTMLLKKTTAGSGAKVRFTQADNHADETRRVTAWNRACKMMGRPDLCLIKTFNF